jgi:hypothetical protein
LKDPLQYPIYKLKIEAGLNENTNNFYSTQLFHLPIQKAVRICNNNVIENFKPFKPVETIDGKAFEPIEIILNENNNLELQRMLKKIVYYTLFGLSLWKIKISLWI